MKTLALTSGGLEEEQGGADEQQEDQTSLPVSRHGEEQRDLQAERHTLLERERERVRQREREREMLLLLSSDTYIKNTPFKWNGLILSGHCVAFCYLSRGDRYQVNYKIGIKRGIF